MNIGSKILFTCLVTVLFSLNIDHSLAKSATWTGDFAQNQRPTLQQCKAWTDFLDQLSPDNAFTSVTMKGSYDPTGITMTDPAAVQELASLLYTRTSGSVTSDGHTWYVYIGCNLSSCVPKGQGVELRIDKGEGCQCLNSESYTVRPDIGNPNWGGVNTVSCGAESQTMMVEFSTISDSDADGIADNEDMCPQSDLNQTVVVDNCDSGIENTLFSDGCTIKDMINRCADNSKNHGQYVSCVSDSLNKLKIEGLISGKAKGAVQKCVATGKT